MGFCIDCKHIVPRAIPGDCHSGSLPGCASDADTVSGDAVNYVTGTRRVRRSVCAWKNDHGKCREFEAVSAYWSFLRRMMPTIWWGSGVTPG